MGSTKVFLWVAATIFNLTATSAQTAWGTSPSPTMVAYDANNPASYARITSLPKANKVFSVYAYICLGEDEQPVTTPADIQVEIDKANAAFAPIGFSFRVCEFITIPDYRYRDIDEGVKFPELQALHYKPEVINMYFTGAANANPPSPLDGFSFMPGDPDAVVLGGDAMDPASFSIIHQLGNFFGLYKTFEQGAFGPELANGSNCQVAGDLICDTEADPGTNEGNCRITNQPYADVQGTRYAPPFDNYMSYSECACRFTVEQYQRMYNIYNTNRNYLK